LKYNYKLHIKTLRQAQGDHWQCYCHAELVEAFVTHIICNTLNHQFNEFKNNNYPTSIERSYKNIIDICRLNIKQSELLFS